MSSLGERISVLLMKEILQNFEIVEKRLDEEGKHSDEKGLQLVNFSERKF